MALTSETIMETLPQDCRADDLGRAVADLLRERHPEHTAKHVARRLSSPTRTCTLRTAENILAGHLSSTTITRLTKTYGLGFLIEAGASVTGQTLRQFIRDQADGARSTSDDLARRERAFRALDDALPLGSPRLGLRCARRPRQVRRGGQLPLPLPDPMQAADG